MATEILNERLLYPSYEIIGGEKIMSPSAAPTHGGVIGRLLMIIGNYLDANNLGYVFADDIDVYFPDGSLYKPDLSVVLKANEKIIDWRRGIFGSPDMVVEVLSYSTRKKDLTIKKFTYEATGVREYWIIDPWAKIIDVYLLRDGKYFLDEIYHNYPEDELKELTDEERAEIKFEIPVAVLDGFKVKIKNIFGRYIEP